MKRSVLRNGFILFFAFFLSCSKNMDTCKFAVEEGVIALRIYPPLRGDFVDSMRVAFQNALVVAGYEGDAQSIDKHFVFRKTSRKDAVIQMIINKEPRLVYISESLIREYGWNGYLLIGLHEIYHVYGARNLNNEDAHEQMAKDAMFHEWIQKTLGCSPGEAECLAYVGMENTSAYDNLPKEKKEAIASCEKNIT